MAREIAVFMGPDGASVPLDKQGKLVVFRLAQGAWEIAREQDVSLGDAAGMRQLRQKMSAVVRYLNGCRIFVARSATGIPYFELEKAGCSIWEYEGRPSDFLGLVWAREESEQTAEATRVDPELPVPDERSPGNFFISIKEIQSKNAELSSKQILREFIRKGAFRSLHIVCGHIPPWIEVEAERIGLRLETEQMSNNEFAVRLANKVPGA